MLKEQERHFTPLVFFLDALSMFLALIPAGLLAMNVPGTVHPLLNRHLAALPALAVVLAFLYRLMLRRRTPWSQKMSSLMRDTAVPCLLAGAIFCLCALITGLRPRVLLFSLLFGLFAWLISSAGRIVFLEYVRCKQKSGEWIKYILLAGTGERAREAARLVDGHPGWGLRLLGFLTGEKSEVGLIISNYRVVGLVDDLPRIVEDAAVDTVYFTGESDHAPEMERLAYLCKSSGKEFVPHAPGL